MRVIHIIYKERLPCKRGLAIYTWLMAEYLALSPNSIEVDKDQKVYRRCTSSDTMLTALLRPWPLNSSSPILNTWSIVFIPGMCSVHLALGEHHVIVTCPLCRIPGLHRCVEVVIRFWAMVAEIRTCRRATAATVTAVVVVRSGIAPSVRCGHRRVRRGMDRG